MRGEDIIIMFSVVGLAFLVSAVNEKKKGCLLPLLDSVYKVGSSIPYHLTISTLFLVINSQVFFSYNTECY